MSVNLIRTGWGREELLALLNDILCFACVEDAVTGKWQSLVLFSKQSKDKHIYIYTLSQRYIPQAVDATQIKRPRNRP